MAGSCWMLDSDSDLGLGAWGEKEKILEGTAAMIGLPALPGTAGIGICRYRMTLSAVASPAFSRLPPLPSSILPPCSHWGQTPIYLAGTL